MAFDGHELHPLSVLTFTPQDEQGEVNLLLEDDLERQLSIPVGACGAQAVMLAARGVRIDRPLTHELLLSLIEYLDARVDRLIIDDVSKGVYYARLELNTPDGPISLDCRPSDGLAVALRAGAPCFATNLVIQGEHSEE